MSEFLENMNERQAEAIQATEGPLLVMAGAGSGKTRVLTHRIAYLVSKGVNPYNILAITFTNKAAAEMKERTEQLVGRQAYRIWISTFHAMCVRILRQNIEHLGYGSDFGIIDDADQISVIKDVMRSLNMDPKLRPPKYFLARISEAKNKLQFPGDLKLENLTDKDVGEVYERYQAILVQNNRVDFDDLLLLTVRLLREQPEVLAFYQDKFQYIHVDEYQDTNHAQYNIVKLLADKHRNICVVGDSDQSIYSWRGADVGNILSFEKDYADAKIIKLEQNYRSKQMILDAANDVIKHNYSMYEKKLFSDLGEGSKVRLYNASAGDEEVRHVLREIKKLSEDKYRFGDCTILYRTNSQSRLFEQTLRMANIPFRIVGGMSYFKRKEIKDIIAYLRLILSIDMNPDDLSFLRIVNEPKRGIGATSIERLRGEAGMAEASLFDTISETLDILGSTAINRLMHFKRLIQELASVVDDYTIGDFIERVLDITGYRNMLIAEETIESLARIDNLEEFKSVAITFEKDILPDLLEEEGSEQKAGDLTTSEKLALLLNDLMLQTDVKEENEEEVEEGEDNKVTLMTIHAAKGLEFPVVFIVGFEEGLFPIYSAVEEGGDAIDEERRLAYVAITRAKELLYISNSRKRMHNGNYMTNKPSRFLTEIDENRFEVRAPKRSFTLASNAPLPSKQKPKKPVGVVAAKNLGKGQIFSSGDKITHPSFGDGVVVSADGPTVSIAFGAEHGIKKLMASHPAIKKR